MKKVFKHLAVAVALVVACVGSAHAESWTGLGDGASYEDVNNWNTTNAFPGSTRDISGVFNVVRAVDVNVNRTFVKNGATLNVTGGSHNDGQSGAGIYNFVGDTGTGTVNQSAGYYGIGHGLRLGVGGGTGNGTYNLTGGDLNVYRGSNSKMEPTNPGGRPSMEVGDSNGGVGLFEISGSATLTTRGGVHIAQDGVFSVAGSVGAVDIGLSGSGDGSWIQNGTLKVAIDAGGFTTIWVDDWDDTGGVVGEFRAGSILDASFLGGHVETNSWKILELENGTIVDSGLTFAPTVDTNLWTKEIVAGQQLWVSYAGARIPEATTNLYADAVAPVSMAAETWHLWNPEGNPDTVLSNQSSSGFVANFGMVANAPPLGYYPVVAQEFNADQDISEVGQAVRVGFDVEILDPIETEGVTGVLDTDFRFAFYDTHANSQIISGMIDLGEPNGATMRMRLLNLISGTDTNQFVPGDYALLGLGYDTWTSATGYPGAGLTHTGGVYHFETTLARTASNEVSVTTDWWWLDEPTNVITCALVIDETSPAFPEWMPPSGRWDTVNGFGFMLFDEQPFWRATEGSFEISNLEVSHISTSVLPGGFSYIISDLAMSPSGDVTLALSDPVVGAAYQVFASDDLLVAKDVVGSYMAEAPGTITIPAADLAPYTSDEGFLGADLPVTAVIVLP